MIKFRVRGENGRSLLGFGLSRVNIDRLTAGEPIHAPLEEIHLPGTDLVIFFGETEEMIGEEMRQAGLITDVTAMSKPEKQ